MLTVQERRGTQLRVSGRPRKNVKLEEQGKFCQKEESGRKE